MNEVDQLLLNAQLRDEIEPYADESIQMIEWRNLSLASENEFLASMLAWEKAPVRPIAQWFEPSLVLPNPELLTDDQLRQLLHQVIGRLYEKNIVLEFTDHLSDRQLMCVIMRDILPAQEKQFTNGGRYLRWQCIDELVDEEIWLTFYATDSEREEWALENHAVLPEKRPVPFPRRLPGIQ